MREWQRWDWTRWHAALISIGTWNPPIGKGTIAKEHTSMWTRWWSTRNSSAVASTIANGNCIRGDYRWGRDDGVVERANSSPWFSSDWHSDRDAATMSSSSRRRSAWENCSSRIILEGSPVRNSDWFWRDSCRWGSSAWESCRTCSSRSTRTDCRWDRAIEISRWIYWTRRIPWASSSRGSMRLDSDCSAGRSTRSDFGRGSSGCRTSRERSCRTNDCLRNRYLVSDRGSARAAIGRNVRRACRAWSCWRRSCSDRPHSDWTDSTAVAGVSWAGSAWEIPTNRFRCHPWESTPRDSFPVDAEGQDRWRTAHCLRD